MCLKKMKEDKLTSEQAYLSMYFFLEEYFQRTNSDDIGGLLGGLSILEDGGPADSAVTDDWAKAVKSALDGKVSAKLQLKKT